MKMVRLVGLMLMVFGVIHFQWVDTAIDISDPVDPDMSILEKTEPQVEAPKEPLLAPQAVKTLVVPPSFYALRPFRKFETIDISDDEPIFYILVHGTFSAEDDTPVPERNFWGEAEFIERVPRDFFGEGSNFEKAPFRFAFGWSGAWDDNKRKKDGEKFAAGIRYFKRMFPKSRIICLGHSHGGNILNAASQHLKSDDAMDYVIELATPVLTYNAKKEQFDKSSGYYPNANGIGTLMLFYSEMDFVQSLGAGHTSYKRRFGPIAGIDLYNVRLRKLRGKDDLHIRMHDRVIGKKILSLCDTIKKKYRRNKNLIADITAADRRKKTIDALSPKQRKKLSDDLQSYNRTMDMLLEQPLIAIKPYSGSKSSMSKWFTGESTDAFWTDWNGKSLEEEKRSKEDATLFKDIFGFDIDSQLSLAERSARAVYGAGKEFKRSMNAGDEEEIENEEMFAGLK